MINYIRARPHAAAAVGLGALYVLLYLLMLGVRPLATPDEVRYGEVAREMIASGDWVVPRLNGLLYFEKPPFGHWMNALSLLLFGENAFAVRFTSAISAGMSALIVLYVGRHFFEKKTVILLSILIYLTMFEVQLISTFGILDAMFSAVLNGGIALFAVGAIQPAKRQRNYILAAGALFGIAFLTKGFLAFVLPCLVLVPWLLLRRQYGLLFKSGWYAVIISVGVVLPWAIAIHVQQPDFWHYFIWVEHIQRFTSDRAQHLEPFYYYLMVLPGAAFPWLFLVPAAISSLRERQQVNVRHSGVALLSLWAFMPFLFFTLSNGKLITYILPCFVPLALLMGKGISGSTASKSFIYGMALNSLAMLIGLGALFYAQFFAPDHPLYQADELAKFQMLTVCLLLGVLIFIGGAINVGSEVYRKLSSGFAVIPLLLVLPWGLPQETTMRKGPVDFLQESAISLPANAIVVTNGGLPRAVSWSLKRDDVYVIEYKGELAYGLSQPDAAGRFLPSGKLAALLKAAVAENREFLIFCKNNCKSATLEALPGPTVEKSFGNFYSYRSVEEK